MAFKEIEGQQRVIDFFRRAVAGNRLAHAYLFLGPGGLGKGLLARNLAKFVNCQNPIIKDNIALDCCDSCANCRRINEDSHPDVHWVVPTGRSKKVSIDSVREAQKQAALKPYEARSKVFIIEDAQYLGEEAAHCLLKTLEEPAEHNLIILTSDTASRLLPTIVSRCQVIKFYPLENKKLRQILFERGLTKNEVQFLSAQSEGCIGLALNLKNSDALNRKNRLIDSVLRSDQRLKSADIFELKDKNELSKQISYLLNWFRDILVFKAGAAQESIVNADRLKGIEQQAPAYELEQLERILTRIDKTHRLIEQNINPKIALEVMLLEIKHARSCTS